jgi:rhomboid family GlyGly-CTERM serine protease
MRLPWLSLGLAALAVALHQLPGARELLAWDRAGLAGGELWRLISGHWVHWSSGHLAWDVATFAVLGAACELRARRSFVACIVIASLAISLALYLWLPGLDACAGLSGVDCALFAWLGVEIVTERWRSQRVVAAALTALLGVAFASKVGFELATGGTLFVADLGSGVLPVPAAHLVGAGVGLAAALQRFTPAARTFTPAAA